MRVQVLFFGQCKELLGREAETLVLPEPASVQQVLEHYAQSAPQMRALLPALAVAVNQVFAQAGQRLQEGDEVALLPPVSGGAPEPSGADTDSRVCLQQEPIDAAALLAQCKQGEDGAVVVFDGIVRNNTRGRRTQYLVYEAYPEMALAQMRALVREAKEKFSIREACIVHRLGRLEIGQTSVWIAVASAHRAAAFDACRWIIDTLKKTVPIWKKEYFVDGAVWADGEPFPAEIAVTPVPKN
jgi:molybdopterin converting factor subunit 1